MTDSKPTEEKTEEQNKSSEPEQQFLIQRVYLKDLSFESPMGAKAFIAQIQPKIDQELGTEAKKIDENLYEAVLKLTVTATLEDETAFLVEVQQAGLFYIKGINAENLPRVLNTVCPQILFPYAREAIDGVLTKGSFPPVMLPPVNFEALFAQAMAEKKAKAH
jgi:preprotein translocase subunit SecB